ncbi:MAG: type II toxin-antitoxin system HicB family antitoxin [Nitrospirae bacterium]|nr:type II toxin-antitoxin system HicB family antitoxin [Nitrospirota bacterium]MBF0540251.1 type II toxin-antitoxin system HicB family antitoxin [Nitrospirota bacterium]
MKQLFHASIWQEGKWFVAQCLEIDIASQGETKEDAIINLSEALELYLEKPTPTIKPYMQTVEVELSAT